MWRATIIATLISAFIVAGCADHKGSFSIINKTNEAIVGGSVVICQQRIVLPEVPPGSVVTGAYKVTSDSHYNIEVEFASGKKLHKEVGYVTNGMDFQDAIAITESDIEITTGIAK